MEQDFEKIEKEPKEEYREKLPVSEPEEGKKEILERKEITEEKEKVRQELEKEIEKIKLSPQTKIQAQKQADELKKQTAQGKIQHLLDLAQSDGLAYAVEVVRKMNDPYLLDRFHDTLTKNGLFKKFLQK